MDIFAVDVDSVVAELGDVWLGRYNKDYNDHLTSKDIRSWDTHLYVKPECGKKIYEYLEDPTLYDEVLPVIGSQDGIKFIKQFCRVVYVTSSTVGASGAKYRWLRRYGFITNLDDYMECKDKSLIRTDYLLDDRFENVVSFHGFGILFNRPWNRGSKYFYSARLKDWNDIYEARKIFGF
jgi:5'-nucleotidase